MTERQRGDRADERQWTLIDNSDNYVSRWWVVEDDLGRVAAPEPTARGERVEVVPLERAQRAEEAARGFAVFLFTIQRVCEGSWRHQDIERMAAQGLDRHPGFLPNDPGENG